MKADGTVNRAALPAIFNPEDLNALEQALVLKDMFPGLSLIHILVVAQLPVQRRAVVIEQHVVRAVKRHFVIVREGVVVVSDLIAQNRPVEISQRAGRIECQHPAEILDCLHRTVDRRIDECPVEVLSLIHIFNPASSMR